MKSRRPALVVLFLMIATSIVVALPGGAGADPTDPAPDVTPLSTYRRGAIEDVTYLTGPPAPNDYIWFAIQDPHGCGKVMGAVKATNVPPLVGWNVFTPNADGTCTYSNQINLLAAPLIETSQPKIYGADPTGAIEFAWHALQQNWTLDYQGSDLEIHVTFNNPQPGGAFDSFWDGQPVFWSSSIGRADVTGGIKFPGQTRENATQISNWYGEEERMAGGFEVFPGHNGYEYAQGGNSDGSADLLFVFDNLDGTFRGLITHTGPTFSDFALCEPTSGATLTDYQVHPDGVFVYPMKASASCSGPMGSVSKTFTSITPRFMAVPDLSSSGTDNTDNNYFIGPVGVVNVDAPAAAATIWTTMNDACVGTVCNGSSRANFQHLRDVGFFGDQDGD